MKKPIKRLLIISQVLGWSALTASSCTNNDQQTISGSVSNKADTDQDTSPTDGNTKGDLNQQSKSSDPMKNESDKQETDMSQGTGETTNSGSPTTNNITAMPGSGTKDSMNGADDSSIKKTQEDTPGNTDTGSHDTSGSSGGETTMKSPVPEKKAQDKDEGDTASIPEATSDSEEQAKKVEGAPNQGQPEGTPGAKGDSGAEHHETTAADTPEPPAMQK